MWIDQSPAVKRWLGRQSPSTAYQSRYYLRDWLLWLRARASELAELTPDELIEYQRDQGGYAILDSVQGWILEKEGRHSYKQRLYATVRSFFMHNRAELPRDPSFNIRGDRPKVKGTLTVEEFKQVLASCNRMFRAIYICMFQAGLGSAELVWWSHNGLDSLKQQLNGDLNPLKIDLPGRKMNKYERPYYTFIAGDAIRLLRTWMERRPTGGDIFINQYGNPVTCKSLQRYWTRHLLKVGLIHTPTGFEDMTINRKRSLRYGKNLHELRDLFRSRWQKSGRAPEAAEFMMGHIVDPLEYNKAFRDEAYVRAEYSYASTWLNILSSEPDKVKLDEIARRDMDYKRKFDDQEKQIRSLEDLVKKMMERIR